MYQRAVGIDWWEGKEEERGQGRRAALCGTEGPVIGSQRPAPCSGAAAGPRANPLRVEVGEDRWLRWGDGQRNGAIPGRLGVGLANLTAYGRA